jgi:FkbM family methyltransferase
MIIYNEYGSIVEHNIVEVTEWKLAKEYVKPYHTVLELGARYGSCSISINENLTNKKNQVSIEPDTKVYEALEKNKNINNAEFNILYGAISKVNVSIEQHEYATFTLPDESGTIKTYDLWEIERMFNLKFDALVADCEGCLSVIIEEYPDFFNQLELIIYEEDCSDKCDYLKMKKILSKNNFNHIVQGFHNVFVR